MDYEELVKLAQEKGLEAGDLDDAVQYAASSLVFKINNSGIERQISFLLENLEGDEVESFIRGD
jgi:hypothetical protein